MSYQVLARKWRPRSFTELVGQEHVVRALVNGLDNDRLHHAFLFTGTRGVGKTTISRIFSKSLNCETGVGSNPCGQCSACREIDEGRFVDLIEVDAASRTKVDDTRELLENVQYAPTRGRYKVYLIDEVHMLSISSFNALLKTLEEPPPHVKFLLATTDPQKLPPTVLSRCLQFNLKRLPVDLIQDHMSRLLQAENIEFEPGALLRLARAADGSMRDGLSLLDQGIAFGGGQVGEAEVRAMLGDIDRSHVYAMLASLADADGSALMQAVDKAAGQSPDFTAVLKELASTLHRIAIMQTVPDAADASLEGHEQVGMLADVFSPEDVQLYYQIALLGQRDMPLAPDERSGFEMVLLRMLAFRPEDHALPTTEGAGQKAPRPAAAPAAAKPAGAGKALEGLAALKANLSDGAGAAKKEEPAPVPKAPAAAAEPAAPPVDTPKAQAPVEQAKAAVDLPWDDHEHKADKDPAVAPAPAEKKTAEPELKPEPVADTQEAPPLAPEPSAPAEKKKAPIDLPWDDTPSPARKSAAPSKPEPSVPAETTADDEDDDGPVGLPMDMLRSARELLNDAPKTPRKPQASAEPPISPPPVQKSADEVEGEITIEPIEEAPALQAAMDDQARESMDWADILNMLDISGVAREVANQCELLEKAQGVVRLRLAPRHVHIRNDAAEQRLAQALGEFYGESIKLEISEGDVQGETPAQRRERLIREAQREAEQAIAEDANIQALLSRFDAAVVEGATRPVDNGSDK